MAWLVCSCRSLQQSVLLGAEVVLKAALLRQKNLSFQAPESQLSFKANKTRCWKACLHYNCEGNLSRRKAILRSSDTSAGAETIVMEIVCTAELICGGFIYTIVEYHEIKICFEGKAMPHHENKHNGLFCDHLLCFSHGTELGGWRIGGQVELKDM